MSWFSYFPRDFDLSSSEPTYIEPPLRHPINIYSIFNTITTDQIIPIDLGTYNFGSASNFLSKISKTAEKTEDTSQYAVVHYDVELDTHTVVKSTVENGYLYFLSAKDHLAGEDIIDEYYLYYGNDHLKYVEEVTYQSQKKYRQISQANLDLMEANASLYDTNLYNLNITDIEDYFNQVNSNEEDSSKQKFSYYNQNTDWLGYKSSSIGAKVAGSFSGPFLRIKAQNNPNAGKIKIKILKEKQDVYILGFNPETGPVEQKEEVFLDWTDIDLYSPTTQEVTIYETDSLENKKYNFTIEIIEQDNKSSLGKEVNITSFSYLQVFSSVFFPKEYNPNLAFKE